MTASGPGRPRVGFLGIGWIGRLRMEAMIEAGDIEVAGLADESAEAMERAARLAPQAARVGTLDELLALGLDGIVIATPSALHAAQAIQALDRGAAVFCQKPLGRTAAEVEAVVAAARRAGRLLGVDFSYRHTDAMRAVREEVASGALGRIFALELVFHNAYGPDKPWFYDRAQSGGGCVMDLGVHLVDLALWLLDFPEVSTVSADLHAAGLPLEPGSDQVEDHAVATLRLATGASVQLACSWRLNAGQDAVISATVFGTQGGVRMRNVGGSFYDFAAERLRGTRTEPVTQPPDAWGGRSAVSWGRALRRSTRNSESLREHVEVARAIDLIYLAGSRHLGEL